jgi:nucleotide-binding universal stress UspA family protein
MNSSVAGTELSARPVMAAVSSSTTSHAAARAAARTAHEMGVPLELVRVVALPSEDPVDERGSGVELHAAAGGLDALRKESASRWPDLVVTAVLRRGRTSPQLVEASWSAERLVLGEHTTGPGLGSVTDLLVRRAHSPVLLHRRGARPTGPVVVGLDCFPGTEELLAVAADEAVRRGTVLQVVHGRSAHRPAPDVLAVEHDLLDRLVADARSTRPGLRVHVLARHEGAAALLLDAAAGAQVLVLGRRAPGAGGPSSGARTTLLLRSPCSLLLVPAERAAPLAEVPDDADRELVGR